MSDNHEPEHLEHRHIEERPDPHARTFMLFAGALMIAAITFGLLNTFHIIHM
jgi:hypothetical protein